MLVAEDISHVVDQIFYFGVFGVVEAHLEVVDVEIPAVFAAVYLIHQHGFSAILYDLAAII